ncbi:MAG: hypothetical protein B6D57_03115 [Candidatus Coatesbacteria bacterium 4484_99]|uniref:Glycosyl transferase family 1 domain-containing protein n=1 Tax=Candidatus Coatesbacteria bacterium 4484_99 TaxID=1970774 RepID=A0A1W9S0X4_9BACT|nr:MAG: hypothetical protein B6D57_03115 [Candidatus Coatesbacteria bacterium 4484_99]
MSILNNINIISDIINYMRILLVTSLPPPRAGMSLQGQYILNILRDLGHKVRVFKINHRYIVKALLAIFYFLILPLYALFTDKVLIVSTVYGSFYFFTIPTLIYSKITGKPSILFFKGGKVTVTLKKIPFSKYAFKLADRIFVPGRFLHDVFMKYDIETHILPDIIDTSYLKTNSDFTKGKYFLITRSLEKIYGIDIAIKAFHKAKPVLKDIKLVITGDGPERKKIKYLIERLKLNNYIILKGECSASEIGNLLSNALALVNASFYDNFPNSILEAFYAKVPVISSDAGGIPYIIKHQRNGILTRTGDINDMSEKMVFLVKNTEPIKNLIEQAHQDFYDLALIYSNKKTNIEISKSLNS